MPKNTEDQPKESFSPEDQPEPKHQERWHLVKPGENLTVIAQTYYGPEHDSHWITLYNFNRELISENPDVIKSGIVLQIPDLSEFL